MTSPVLDIGGSLDERPVLLTGATGFVGRHLYPELIQSNRRVRSGTRDPERAAVLFGPREWVKADLQDPATLLQAMDGCGAAIFLVHHLADGAGYSAREEESAIAFGRAARAAGIERIVYLGGVSPAGSPSRHLSSRIACGRALASEGVPTVELRAGMILGAGSESFRIVRDLSVRLPLMVLPAWLENRSQPISIVDVVFALVASLEVDRVSEGVWDLPGPETLSAAEILRRVSLLRGVDPWVLRVPLVSPQLSSYWIQWVTRANPRVARELVEGLQNDLLAEDTGFWSNFPDHRLLSFDEAARRALDEERRTLPRTTLWVEDCVKWLSPRAQGKRP
ncbi:MAG: NAD(P)H-binding protein [Myxococcales bacterium]|nr:NAD(P)H-binding protein [Myxococcales bacterium]